MNNDFHKMMKLINIAPLIMLYACSDNLKENGPQWRGPERNGIYFEKNLLKEWPEDGPELIWSYEGLGAGHGNVGISKDRIFILGMPDSTGILYSFNHNGKLLWKTEYGPEWHENYTGPRSTPAIVDDLVYFESGHGIVYCYNGITGDMVWSVDLMEKYGAAKVTWGMAESLLIEGDILFCTPGGIENNLAALNRFTGETIWTSPGNKQPSAYCSPVYIRHNEASLIVTVTAESIIGIDALTGQFYWQVPQFQRNKIHANTPVYSEGIIYCSSESDSANSGLVALKLADDGSKVAVLWRNENYKNLMGGIIVNNGYIYGSLYRANTWCCLNTSDGEMRYAYKGLGDGSIIMADGLFYCYTEKGEFALASGDQESFRVISKFEIPLGTDQHFSHPVINKGLLYVRHGNAIMTYDIMDK